MKSTLCQVLAIVLFCCGHSAASQFQNPQRVAASLSKEQVLDRWAEALGGRENLQSVRTIHLHGSIETGGLKGTYERWTSSGGQLRMGVDLSGALRQTNIFDGHRGWVLDTNGTVHEISGDVLKGMVSAAYEASESFLFSGRIPGQVKLVGEDSNQDAYILRLEPENGSPVTVYLDTKTFLPTREETSGPMGNRVICFSDWRDFSGIKIPGLIRQSNGDAKFDAVFTTVQVEINAPIIAGLFERAGDTSVEIHFANGARVAVLPAEVYGDHIFVPVRLNGSQPAWFFLDSGAGISVVSKSWAEKAGLAYAGEVRGQGTGAGSASIGLAKDVGLELAGAQVPPGTIAVWDFLAHPGGAGARVGRATWL